MSSILVVMLRRWEVRLKKAYSKLACFRCCLMLFCARGSMGCSHLHCMREWVFGYESVVVVGVPSADWGVKDLMG